MLKDVTLAKDSTDPSSWTHHQVEDLCAFLVTQFDNKFPTYGHIYHKEVSQITDVTPRTLADIEKLQAMDGPFTIIVYPEVAALPYIFAIIIAAASYFLAPSAPNLPIPPNAALRNSQAPSPNNELSDRQNRARINGRIPDIFGKVRSTPDLIAAPYKVFENNREVEYAYMCVGRGDYEITDIRDGETLCSNIAGVTVEVFAPYTSPLSGDDPVLRIGTPILNTVVTARRSNSVNGQVLRPPNAVSVTGQNNIRFASPNVIQAEPSSTIDFDKLLVEGDVITLTDSDLVSGGSATQVVTCWLNNNEDGSASAIKFALPPPGTLPSQYAPAVNLRIDYADVVGFSGDYSIASAGSQNPWPGEFNAIIVILNGEADADTPSGNWMYQWDNQFSPHANSFNFTLTTSNPSGDFDLNGVYTIVSVTSKEISVDSPAVVSADWNTIPADGTPYISPTIAATGDKWVGPFILESDDMGAVYCNFVASNGLYKDDGTTQTAVNVQIQVQLTPVGLDDIATGDQENFYITLNGSAVNKETVAKTIKAIPTFTGRCSVRARRLTETDTGFTGQVVDEVRWRDAYAISPVTQTDFGNVTTIHSKTFATASALAIKERRLNMQAIRKIPQRVTGSTMTTALFASDDAADIMVAVCLDQYIGKRNPAEIDIPSIYDTADAVEAYFGHVNARKFSYTFDNENVSFEETAASVAAALFSTAYRRGNVIKLSFEKLTDDSTLLFNHRNKLPGTERRAISFGFNGDFDGIVYKYINPVDDSEISIFLPQTTPTKNPKKIDSIGIRNNLQAYFQAHRAINKLQFQNTTTEFDATQEAELVIINDRVLVTDSTRTSVQDGEVVAVATLVLTLSQNVDFSIVDDYVIHLQLTDGTVQVIDITAGAAPNKVVLAGAPTLPLVTDHAKFARTAYAITRATEPQQTAFLISERTPSGNKTSTVRAYNYDARYYANDKDFINDVIDENGYGPAGGFTPGTGTGFTPTDDGGPTPTTVDVHFFSDSLFGQNGYTDAVFPLPQGSMSSDGILTETGDIRTGEIRWDAGELTIAIGIIFPDNTHDLTYLHSISFTGDAGTVTKLAADADFTFENENLGAEFESRWLWNLADSPFTDGVGYVVHVSFFP